MTAPGPVQATAVDPLRRRATEARHAAGRQVRALRRRLLDPRRVRAYLDSHALRKLQLGAGPNVLEGWLNTDLLPDLYPAHRDEIVFLDATRPLPFPDATFDFIFSEHQIEHVSEPDARQIVRECFRILRPGGRIRIATPDLATFARLYLEPLGARERAYVDWVMERFLPQVQSGNRLCYVLNQILNAHGHCFVYDEATLGALLADAGFEQIERHAAGQSSEPELRKLEAHGRAIGNEAANDFETMALEARRPS